MSYRFGLWTRDRNPEKRGSVEDKLLGTKTTGHDDDTFSDGVVKTNLETLSREWSKRRN